MYEAPVVTVNQLLDYEDQARSKCTYAACTHQQLSHTAGANFHIGWWYSGSVSIQISSKIPPLTLH
jgi:hypothetical protein